jgi:hypothetical protein
MSCDPCLTIRGKRTLNSQRPAREGIDFELKDTEGMPVGLPSLSIPDKRRLDHSSEGSWYSKHRLRQRGIETAVPGTSSEGLPLQVIAEVGGFV